MPWDVTIRRPGGEPLGDVDAVCERIAEAVPGAQFYREPSGAERIAAVRARGIEFPEVVRQGLETQPARVRAVFQGGGLSVLLYGFEATPSVAIPAVVGAYAAALAADWAAVPRFKSEFLEEWSFIGVTIGGGIFAPHTLSFIAGLLP